MSIVLDHLVLRVKDADESVRFYTRILGFEYEGRDGPFSVLRVSSELTLQLAAWGTEGGEHLAFALEAIEFEAIFGRICDAGIPYGGSFDSVGSMMGPGEEMGARGVGKAIYFFDPSRHLVEIRFYGRAS